MKIYFLLFLLLANSLQTVTQTSLSINKQEYQNLFAEVREIARRASEDNLQQIRLDLDYLQEGTFLLNNKLNKGNL